MMNFWRMERTSPIQADKGWKSFHEERLMCALAQEANVILERVRVDIALMKH